MNDIEIGTLYELNKQLIKKLPRQSKDVLKNQFINIKLWATENSDKWFMLLCREKADYTLFHCPIKSQTNTVKLIKELKLCIEERGFLKSINKAAEDAWEIWIKDDITNEVYMYMLFPCGSMVVDI